MVLFSTALFIFKGFTMPNDRKEDDATQKSGTVNGGLKSVLSKRITYFALILVCLTSCHQCINSQWSPSYFLYKGYENDVSNFVVAGFWGGVTIGRLAGPTAFKKVHEMVRNLTLVLLALANLGVIWGVDNLAVRATCLSLTGVCWGK